MADETKIPVFSVLKKGVIHKNIVLNIPPQQPTSPILIGRHPDCHIVLDHPSISRFHLDLRAHLQLRQIAVTDHSSVHGTWVSGRRIEPNVAVGISEGDTLRLGASTREYRLRWVEMGKVDEMDQPLETLVEEDEEISQQENPDENWVRAIPSAPPMQENMDHSVLDEPLCLTLESGKSGQLKELGEESKSISSVIPLQQSVDTLLPTMEVNMATEAPFETELPSLLSSAKKAGSSSLLSRRRKSVGSLRIHNDNVGSQLQESNDTERLCRVPFDNVKESAEDAFDSIKENVELKRLSPTEWKEPGGESKSVCSDVQMQEFTGSSSPKLEENKVTENTSFAGEMPFERDHQSSLGSAKKANSSSLLSRRRKSVDPLQVPSGDVVSEMHYGTSPVFKNLFDSMEGENEESFVSVKENVDLSSSLMATVLNSDEENGVPGVLECKYTDTPMPMPLIFVKNETEEASPYQNKENLTPNYSSGRKPKKSILGLQRSPSNELALLNGGDVSVNRVKDENEAHSSYKENLTPSTSSGRKLKKNFLLSQRSASNDLSVLNEEEQMFSPDIFTPNKENLTPKVLNGGDVLDRVTDENEAHSYRENLTPSTSSGRKLKKNFLMSQRSASNDLSVLNEEEQMFSPDIFTPNKENLTPKVLNGGDVLVNRVTDENEAHSYKENLTPSTSSGRKLKKNFLMSQRSASNDLSVLNEEEQMFSPDIFTPNKENLTPKVSGATRTVKSLSKSHDRVLREVISKRMERVPFQCLLENSPSGNNDTFDEALNSPVGQTNYSPNCMNISKQEDAASGSNKDNFTTKDSASQKSKRPLSNSPDGIQREEKMKKGAERVPFQSLMDNSSPRNCNAHNSSNQHTAQVLNKAGEEKKTWNIVVDASCLLDDQSRRSLELLEGLTGTCLIIPRIVIRELDCMKRREGLFSRTRKASSALSWIEMCMVRSSWWIHVQSSFEMMPVAATPPAFPSMQPINGSNATPSSTKPFSSCGSLLEIVSPTAEDHILDCALLFEKLRNDAQFVLLTHSVTLKIKAMAEGLICEAPTEFRESLVSPYSKRFLWMNSSPRGRTWSTSDEHMAPDENYYHQFPNARKVAKPAQGLKIILPRDFHYEKTILV